MISESEALSLWRRALAEPVALAIRTDHRYNLVSRLYSIRAKHKDDEAIYTLQISLPKDSDEVWIHRKPDARGPAKPIEKPFTEVDLDSL